MAENHFAGSPVDWKDERWHRPEDLTCFDCPAREECPFADDWWNTHGDCLLLK